MKPISGDPVERDALNNISTLVLGAAITVHKEIGPGLLESVYHCCMVDEMITRNLNVISQVSVPIVYKGKNLGKEYVIDLLVEDQIILELKSVEVVLPVHEAQVISYLRLANKPLGFLINFNVPLLKNGFKRFVNNF
jgi:GxxExxY protein